VHFPLDDQAASGQNGTATDDENHKPENLLQTMITRMTSTLWDFGRLTIRRFSNHLRRSGKS